MSFFNSVKKIPGLDKLERVIYVFLLGCSMLLINVFIS